MTLNGVAGAPPSCRTRTNPPGLTVAHGPSSQNAVALPRHRDLHMQCVSGASRISSPSQPRPVDAVYKKNRTGGMRPPVRQIKERSFCACRGLLCLLPCSTRSAAKKCPRPRTDRLKPVLLRGLPCWSGCPPRRATRRVRKNRLEPRRAGRLRASGRPAR